MRSALVFAAALAILSASLPAPVRAAADLQDYPTQANGQPRLMTMETDLDARLVRLERWLKAVLHHIPGEADNPASEVNGWSNSELRKLWLDAGVLVSLIRNPKASSFSMKAEGQSRAQEVHYPPVALRRLQVLACAAGGNAGAKAIEDNPRCFEMLAFTQLDAELRDLARRARESKDNGDDNYILRRGAILEADVAMLLPARSEPVATSAGPAPDRFRMNLVDGQGTAFRQMAIHWELARMLLDHVKPKGADREAPGRDEMVRDWYRATAAWAQDREDYDDRHLERAREIFVTDPVILFLSGSQSEVFAAPHIQAAVHSAVAPPGTKFAVESTRLELRKAEGFYRRAVALDPSLPQLQLHLGHVLLLLEHEADAVTYLRAALEVEGLPSLRYYGEMFLGAAEERVGHSEAARQAYAEAAALCPSAQSPRIALSALARRRGDRATALREMQIVFELQHGDDPPADPWWTYYKSHARNADELLDALWRPFREVQQ